MRGVEEQFQALCCTRAEAFGETTTHSLGLITYQPLHTRTMREPSTPVFEVFFFQVLSFGKKRYHGSRQPKH
jgi:hypothetical protein